MKLDITDKESETLLEFVDIGLKQAGIRAMGAANMIVNKINAAKLREQNEKTTPLTAVPDSGAAAGQG